LYASELCGRTIFESRQAATQAIFEYIEVFYSRIRLHSTLGYLNPVQFEEEREEKGPRGGSTRSFPNRSGIQLPPENDRVSR